MIYSESRHTSYPVKVQKMLGEVRGGEEWRKGERQRKKKRGREGRDKKEGGRKDKKRSTCELPAWA